MVFSSPIFLFLFLPLALFFYYLNFKRLRNLTLLVASLIFYSWGEPKFIFFVIFACILNHRLSFLIYKNQANFSERKAKFWFWVAVFFNIGSLVFFKYTNFILNNLDLILQSLNIPGLSLSPIRLPLGISFITFHSLSYIFDVYRKEVTPRKSIPELVLYIVLFPQLIAGPIIRYHDIEGQLTRRNGNVEKFYYGIKRFITGLSKKILIANNIGAVADHVFAMPEL